MTHSRSKSRVKFDLGRQTIAIAVGVAIGLLAVVPLPYFIVAPGNAIDLGTRVSVEGRASSRARFFLTDVTVARATTFGLIARFLPATSIVPSADVIPAGQSSAAFDRSMSDAMAESQNVASFVAERAAGFRVPEAFIVRIAGFPPNSAATGSLREGDLLRSVAGRTVRGNADIAAAIAAARDAASIRVGIERDGIARDVAVPTMRVASGARRLGVYVSSRLPILDLPVPVRFSMDDVSGASGGLLFALQIYDDLHPLALAQRVAGTGTLSPDGSVGPIEGTPQKFEAAKRAGATIFFVPMQNARDLASVSPGTIAIVPVRTFAEALSYLTKRSARHEGGTG